MLSVCKSCLCLSLIIDMECFMNNNPALDNIHYPPELATNLHEDRSFTVIIIIMGFSFTMLASIHNHGEGPPGWKCLQALSHQRNYQNTMTNGP